MVIANIMVIFMCLAISLLNFVYFFTMQTGMNELESELETISRITMYSENITSLYEEYLEFNLFENKLYD